MKRGLQALAVAGSLALGCGSDGSEGGASASTGAASGAGGTAGSSAGNAGNGGSSAGLGGGGSGATGGGGGASGGAGTGGTGGSPTASIEVLAVELNQGVQKYIEQEVAPDPMGIEVPVVGGRAALLRVHYRAATSGEVTAELTLGDGPAITTTTMLISASEESDLESTLNFDVPGDRLTPDSSLDYSIEVRNDDGAIVGRFPDSGSASFEVGGDGGTFELALVPVRYEADGSGRTPELPPAAQDAFADELFRQLPVAAVSVSVEPAVALGTEVLPPGQGWGMAVQTVAAQAMPDGKMYLGLMAPVETMDDWCATGCVQSLSPAMSVSRVGIQVYFDVEDVSLALRPTGTALGLLEAPCGGFNPDPDFPHADGSIGVWGYDLLGGTLKDPAAFTDFMGLCDPQWVSDYHWSKLYETLQAP